MFHIGKVISLYLASSLFWTQQQLFQSPVKSATFPLRKMPVFQGVTTWHKIFYFILLHPSLGLINSSLTLWKRVEPFLSGGCPFFRELHIGIQFLVHLPHPSLGLSNTSPSGRELNPSSREDTRFSGRCSLTCKFHFVLRHPSLGLSKAHSPSGKGLNHSCQEDARFSGCCTLVNKFHFILRHTFLSFLSSSLCL